MKLHLIRHGETIGTEKQLYYGATDLPVTESGLAKLQMQREAGGYPALAGLRLYVTPLQRTKQTFSALFGEHETEILPGFGEINFGIFEMTSYQTVKDDPAYQQWMAGNYEENIPPQGESVRQFQQRVEKQLKWLMSQGESALVVAHSGTISLCMSYLFPQEQRHFYSWGPKTGEGYTLNLEGKPSYVPLPATEERG